MTEDVMQALENERLGPERSRYSDNARRRLAVMEGATSLLCTLLPAIEPVVQVTITPREKFPLGQTVVKANEGRELTQAFTKRYLEEQLLTVLAGRAAEEVVYGEDELSTMQQRRLVLARRIVTKLVVSTAMSPGDVIGPRTISQPRSYVYKHPCMKLKSD
jgi:cell division protease FtsH